mmetsp:Transcript_14785/g.20574  ORF Transcript_14785/g.20574 Transcript_14785/m.20574 type:complete len:96 (-) Transcript_14785:333-620(-)
MFRLMKHVSKAAFTRLEDPTVRNSQSNPMFSLHLPQGQCRPAGTAATRYHKAHPIPMLAQRGETEFLRQPQPLIRYLSAREGHQGKTHDAKQQTR